MADGDMPTKKPLGRDPYRLGDSFVFPPAVMDEDVGLNHVGVHSIVVPAGKPFEIIIGSTKAS